MDTEYVKMCERADEIQRLYPGGLGNFHYSNGKLGCIGYDFYSPAHEVDPEFIWLPRQDQLQAMIAIDSAENTPQKRAALVYDFAMFTMFSGDKFTSMEQLWLAFVMKEKYGKRWSGESWRVYEQG